MSRRLDSRQMIDILADPDSWECWDTAVTTRHPVDYADELQIAR